VSSEGCRHNMVNTGEREASYLHRMLHIQRKYDFLWDSIFCHKTGSFCLRKSISLLCVIPISTNKQEHFLTQLNVPATKLRVCNSTYCMLTIIKKYVNHLCKPFIESSFTIFTVFVPHFCHLLWETFSILRDSFFLCLLYKHKTSIILLVLQFKRQNVHSAVFESPTPEVYGTDFTYIFNYIFIYYYKYITIIFNYILLLSVST